MWYYEGIAAISRGKRVKQLRVAYDRELVPLANQAFVVWPPRPLKIVSDGGQLEGKGEQ